MQRERQVEKTTIKSLSFRNDADFGLPAGAKKNHMWADKLLVHDRTQQPNTTGNRANDPLICAVCLELIDLSPLDKCPQGEFPYVDEKGKELRIKEKEIKRFLRKDYFQGNAAADSNARQQLVTHTGTVHGFLTEIQGKQLYPSILGPPPNGVHAMCHEASFKVDLIKAIAKLGWPASIVEDPEFRDLIRSARKLGPPGKKDDDALPRGLNSRKTVTTSMCAEAKKSLNQLVKNIAGKYFSLHLDIGTVKHRYLVITIRVYDPETVEADVAQKLAGIVPRWEFPLAPSDASKVYYLDLVADCDHPFTDGGDKSLLIATAEEIARDDVEVFDVDEDDDEEEANPEIPAPGQEWDVGVDGAAAQNLDAAEQAQERGDGTFSADVIAEYLLAVLNILTERKHGTPNAYCLNIATDNGGNLLNLSEANDNLNVNQSSCFAHIGQLLSSDLYRKAVTNNRQTEFHVALFHTVVNIYLSVRKELRLPALILTRWNWDFIHIKELLHRLLLPPQNSKHVPSGPGSYFATQLPRGIHNANANANNAQGAGLGQAAINIIQCFVNVFQPLYDFTMMVQHDGATLGLEGLGGLSMLRHRMLGACTSNAMANNVGKAFHHRLFNGRGKFYSDSLAFICLFFPLPLPNHPNPAVAAANVDDKMKAATALFAKMDNLGQVFRQGSSLYNEVLRFFTNMNDVVASMPVNPVTCGQLREYWQSHWRSSIVEKNAPSPLAYLMRCFLQMSISEASVERVFSILGWIINKRRYSLLTRNVSAFMRVRFDEPFGSSVVRDVDELSNLSIDLTLIREIQHHAITQLGQIRAPPPAEVQIVIRCKRCTREVGNLNDAAPQLHMCTRCSENVCGACYVENAQRCSKCALKF